MLIVVGDCCEHQKMIFASLLSHLYIKITQAFVTASSVIMHNGDFKAKKLLKAYLLSSNWSTKQRMGQCHPNQIIAIN